ncbi:hypothetical protein [Pseudomonas sp. NPDC086251]|uniref:hypothetical protein n=1 Tax=Pseudomonas sp. NPDC086251 TaxID=3364431 RepID=UPI0038395FD4
MKQQIPQLTIALIICATVLYLFGAFDKKEMNFATAYHEGGFKKLGEISEQSAFSDIQILVGSQEIYSGSAEEIIDILQASLNDEGHQITWRKELRVRGKFGVRWTGSENTFELTTDKIDLTATPTAPVDVPDTIKLLTEMSAQLKRNLPTYADQTLRFSATSKDVLHF